MNGHYTFMIIPEKNKKIFSFRLPSFIIHSFSFICVVVIFVLAILIYDYKQILNQVYENKQLSLQNQKLKDQLNIFQMKIGTLTEEVERIHIFEKKLRTITGVDQGGELLQKGAATKENTGQNPDLTLENSANDNDDNDGDNLKTLSTPLQERALSLNIPTSAEEVQETPAFIQLKQLYHEQLIQDLGLSENAMNKAWPGVSNQSNILASEFAFFDYKYNTLKNAAENLENSLHTLDQYLLDQESILRSTPTLLPTRGWITSYFGVRPSPYSGRLKIHEGLDIGGQRDTPIVAPADGLVVYSGQRPGFGKFVQIDHGHGLETVYGHCEHLSASYGQKVQRGDLIATVGNTGLSTGPHLHYEVRVNGVAVDPLYYILD